MENLLSALAFAGLIAAQFLSVVLVNTQRCEDPSPGTRNRIARASAVAPLLILRDAGSPVAAAVQQAERPRYHLRALQRACAIDQRPSHRQNAHGFRCLRPFCHLSKKENFGLVRSCRKLGSLNYRMYPR